MDDILTVEEAMAYLKIGRSTLLKLTRDGDIPARKVGRAWRYTSVNLQAYVAGELPEQKVEAVQAKKKIDPKSKEAMDLMVDDLNKKISKQKKVPKKSRQQFQDILAKINERE